VSGPGAVACCVTLLAVSFESSAAQAVINGFDPPSVRTAGLGGASVAILGDAAAIFANPTGIATIRSAAFEGSYEHRANGALVRSGAAAVRIGRFDWGLGAERVDLEPAPADVLGLGTLVVRYGVLAAGASGKYVERNAAGPPVHAWASDAGVAIALFDIAALAASVVNLTGDFSDGTHLRRITRAGLTMNYVDPQGTWRLLTTLEGRWPEDARATLAAGAEAGIVTKSVGFVARFGAAGGAPSVAGSPLTLGAGLALGPVRFDYAYQSVDQGHARHQFGLRWSN